MLAPIFAAFAQASPVSVMMRGLMEQVFRPERLDEIFARVAKVQYERELLFSNLVNLLSLVVCGMHPSVNAAYKAAAVSLNVSRGALYQKLNGVEIGVSAALLRETARELGGLIDTLGGPSAALLPGYAVRILDGNALAATEHRLQVLREVAAAPLPGKSLVVLDPERRLAVDIFPCEDGHAQERRLFDAVLGTVQAGQLWIADRNMCTLGFLLGINQRQASFVIREHQNLPWQAMTDGQFVAVVNGDELFEQTIQIEQDGSVLSLRRVVLRLAKPTRHEETELVFLTNLPITIANALVVTHLYRERWQIEHLFLTVTMNFNAEINTLAYPKAALLSFSLALVCYNILATIKAALAAEHGGKTIHQELSDFYLVDEIQAIYRGLMIAIPAEHWQLFQQMSASDLAEQLKTLAHQVNLRRFRKQPRQSKVKTKKRVSDPKQPHVSTAKLLSPD